MNTLREELYKLSPSQLNLLYTFHGVDSMSSLENIIQSRGTMTADEEALFKAIENNGDVTLIKTLLERGVDVNVRNKFGNTPLTRASLYGHIDTVRYLLEHGADISLKNKSGKTAYDYATDPEIRKLLLPPITTIAELNVKLREGKITADFAKEWSRTYRQTHKRPKYKKVMQARIGYSKNDITSDELQTYIEELTPKPVATEIVKPEAARDCNNDTDVYSLEPWTSEYLPTVKIQVRNNTNDDSGDIYCFKREDILTQLNTANDNGVLTQQWLDSSGTNAYFQLKLYIKNCMFRNTVEELRRLVADNDYLLAIPYESVKLRMQKYHTYVLYTPEVWNKPEVSIMNCTKMIYFDNKWNYVVGDIEIPYRFNRTQILTELLKTTPDGKFVNEIGNPPLVKLPLINTRVANDIYDINSLIVVNNELYVIAIEGYDNIYIVTRVIRDLIAAYHESDIKLMYDILSSKVKLPKYFKNFPIGDWTVYLHEPDIEYLQDLIKMLILAGVDINNMQDSIEYINFEVNNVTPLVKASSLLSSGIVKALIMNGAKVDVLTPIGTNALFEACRGQSLREAEVDPIVYDNFNGVYTDKLLAENKLPTVRYTVIKMLVDAGVDVNNRAINGDTCLIALQQGRDYMDNPAVISLNDHIIKLLVERGIDVNACNNARKSALDIAYEYGYTAFANSLLAVGAKSCKKTRMSDKI